ncbi:hypothetical protein WOLCODRAFT_29671 [Wolfiporia cocos MD-104 SS10]|uniref:Uncharacterized protein n=1 Tax=Wolfiporia cocos (strain MD-104) TaxID=742152 RepID=A0A2H3JIG1_WOLCO|nr:hypothetical protein WOLCODRAFT_29671 [Wolfiporia cocos MD-104 SS10]
MHSPLCRAAALFSAQEVISCAFVHDAYELPMEIDRSPAPERNPVTYLSRSTLLYPQARFARSIATQLPLAVSIPASSRIPTNQTQHLPTGASGACEDLQN